MMSVKLPDACIPMAMATSRKYLLIAAGTLATLVVLALLGLYIAVMNIDIERHRDQIEALLTRSLDREVKIGGAIRLERSLQPSVHVADISIANPAWAARPHFATARRLQLQVALLPLLEQRLQIVRFGLVEADIELQRSRDGRRNWEFGGASEESAGSKMVAEVFSVTIQRSKLAYREPDGTRHELRIDDLQTFLAPGRPVHAHLKARHEGLPVDLRLDGGTLEEMLAPTKAWRFRGRLSAGYFRADFDGSAREPLKLTGVDTSLRYYGTKAGGWRSALTDHVPQLATYRGEAHFTSGENGYRFDASGEGAEVELSRLWSGADGSSALEISARQLDFKGSGTTRNLAQLFVQANWELSAQDAGLRWHYADGRPPLVIDGASVEATAKAGGVIEAVVQGRFQEETISARGTLGGLDALLAPKKTWNIDVSIETAKAQGTFRGAMGKPLSQARFDGAISVKADRLATIGQMFGLELPARGPAAASGRLVRDPDGAQLSNVEFMVGGSRLRGELAWLAKDSPRLRINVKPSVIRFEDLRDDAKPKPEPGAKKGARLMPAIPLADPWIRKASMEVLLDDVQFSDGGHALATFDGEFRVVDGRLFFKSTRSQVAGVPGSLALTIDASRDPAAVSAEVDASAIDYGALLKAGGITDGVQGKAALRARISGQGNDLVAMLQGAQGSIEILGGQGRIRGRLLEVWGGNLMQLFNPVSWAQGTDTELNCVAGRLKIEQGVARSELLLLDSRDVTVAGEFALNLASEEISGLFKPQPKQATLMQLSTPLRLSGTLASPRVRAADRSAVTLGKLVIGIAQPAALILFFGDLGAKEKDPCAALLAQPLVPAPPPAGQ